MCRPVIVRCGQSSNTPGACSASSSAICCADCRCSKVGSRAAAEAICEEVEWKKVKGKSEVEDTSLLPFTFSLLPLLASLADKSLLRRRADGRYDLHEVI